MNRRRLGLALGLLACAVPLIWCGVTYVEVHRLRGEVARDVSWLMRVDEARQEVGRLTSAALDGGDAPPQAPAALTSDLDALARDVPDGVPAETWRASAARWQRLYDSRDRTTLGRADRRFGRETSELVRSVRRGTAARSRRLGVIWVLVWVLGVLFVIAAATMTYLFWRSRQQAHALRHAKLALEESERRTRAVYSMPPDLVWAVDGEGRWTYLSEGVQELYGYHGEEMIGRRFDDFAAPDVGPAGRLGDPAALGSRFRFRTTHIRGDGRPVDLLMGVTPMRQQNGTIIGATGTALDVTDLEQADARRATS